MNGRIKHLYNPFLLTGYVSPEYFCDRKEESRKIVSALHNGRNITLTSPRRMGKTGLIMHVFNRLAEDGNVACFYVDLYQTDTLSLLVKKLGETVLGSLDTSEDRVINKVFSFFRSLRPVVTVDPLTGSPGFTVDVRPEHAEMSLVEIFRYMEQADKRCVVAFDEFQTVSTYADKNVESLLRSHIQHLTNVGFIFSGSQRHVLENMFVSASRPFYQSTQMMSLGPIGIDRYYDFAKEKFGSHGQSIEKPVFQRMYDGLYAHTWYVQSVLNRLYETAVPEITDAVVDAVLDEIVRENEATYQTFLRLITPVQAAVLRAIAREGSAGGLQSKAFLTRYGLGSASSVKTAATALSDKELIIDGGAEYQVYDRFFALYLRKL